MRCLLLVLLMLVSWLPVSWAQAPAQLINGNRTHAGGTNYGSSTGTATAYVLTLNAAIPGYVEGACYLFKAHVANTGAATLNVNGRGAKAFRKNAGSGLVPLTGGEFSIGQPVFACDNGTEMVLQTFGATGGSGIATMPTAADQVLVSDSSTAGTWQSIPNCPDTGGNHLNYNISTNQWTCGTSGGTVGSVAFSAITGGTNSSAAMVVGTGASLGPSGTGTILATALAGDPSPCAAPAFVRDLAANGTLTCVQPAFTDLAGNATDAQIPNLSTLSTGLTASRCVQTDASGLLGVATGLCGTGGTSVTWGAGLQESGGVASTASTEAGFVADGGATVLVCGAGNQGKMQVLDDGTLQYCDGAPASVLQSGRPTPANLTWNVNPTLCYGAANAGALTVNTINEIVCSPDDGGVGAGNVALDLGANASDEATSLVRITSVGDGRGLMTESPADTLRFDWTLVPTADSIHTFTNKQNVPRHASLSIVSNAITPTCDLDVQVVNAIAAPLTINQPLCTGGNPRPAQDIELRFFSNSPQALTWNAIITAENGLPLPPSTTGNATTYDWAKLRWNEQSLKWGLLAATFGVTKGITSLPSSTTYTCPGATSSQCEMQMTGLSGTLIMAPPFYATGGPVNGDTLKLLTMCTNSQTFNWNTIFLASAGVALPTVCPASVTTWTMVEVQYSSVLSKWQAIANSNAQGSASGQGFIHLSPVGLKLAPTDTATPDVSENNDRLLFDAATRECGIWQFQMHEDYASSPSLRLQYSMTSAAGAVGFVIDVSIMAVTSGDAADINTNSYAAVNTCVEAAVPATAGHLGDIVCPLTNTDGLVAGDLTKVQVCRNTTHASDTAGGDLEAVTLMLRYSR